ncbi:TnsD family Tn7-like transposition protein [Janthinobacterium sp. SUN176]|uniref:TnsD family Tn7-like transposition protein n=1 Tax=Janthinobacterium sp. SUN176 TaxID=3014788 RepID=UPI00272E7AA3|nr:TnsD family Tn7-like transposition protein [Janthinobacterium sp. SUN176]
MASTPHLFSESPLLTWIGSETLFSLASRYHCFSGSRSADATSIALFGSSRRGCQHDLPAGIDEFNRRTEGLLGTAFEICTTRTLLRFYSKFISSEDELAAVSAMRGTTVIGLKYRLGILTSRFRAHHPLKACRQCMAEDLAATGWSNWHIEHQFPGVWVCAKHDQFLLESKVKSNGVERFLWHLPNAENLLPAPELPADAISDLMKDLTRLALLTNDLVTAKEIARVDLSRLHLLYQAELRRRDSLHSNERLPLLKIAAEFEAHIRLFRNVPELAALPADTDQAYTQLSRYLRCPRAGTHPLRHLIMIDWLFGDYGKFLEAYRAGTSPSLIDTKLPHTALLSEATADTRREEFSAAVLRDLRSVSSAAKKIGIDVATGMAWATQLGIACERRPKKLVPTRRASLIEELLLGIDKAEAAVRYQISVGTVTHVLRTEIGLHATWKKIRLESTLNSARTSWSDLISENAGLGVKFIRKLEPALYAWLYRNDRHWLSENSNPRFNPDSAGIGILRAPWNARDMALSSAITSAVLRLVPGLGRKQLRLWHLYQEIPELRAKLSALHRLPQTVIALDKALGRKSRQTHISISEAQSNMPGFLSASMNTPKRK